MSKFYGKILPLFYGVFFFYFAAVAWAAEPVAYMVSADIVATTETPGLEYPRENDRIDYMKGLKEALLYGNIVKVVPLGEGEHAGRWGEAFSDEGGSLGYIDLSTLTPLPPYDAFPPEPFRFMADSTDLFIVPGSLPVVGYTLPDAAPYRVVVGEVVDGVGTYRDKDGRSWTLLSFETSSLGGIGLRYAWARSDDLMRLSAYEPDYAKVDPHMVPRDVRDFGRIEDKFFDRIVKHGFAIDAAPVFVDDLVLDDLVQSYPDAYGQANYIPNFVTTDLFLHAFHLVFSRALKNMEEINFAPELDALLKDALKKLEALEKKSGKDAFVKAAFARARDFLTVPALLMDPKAKHVKPSELAKGEISRILKAEGIGPSAISGSEKEDYSFYKPRGHYSGSESLSRYFRAMAYLGGMPVLLNGGSPEKDRANAALIAVLCSLFEEKGLFKRWNAIFEPMVYLVGAADDPSILDYGPVVKKILGGKLNGLGSSKTLEALRKGLLAATPASKIVDRPGSEASMAQDEREAEAAGFRLMGRRFVLDAWVFSKLTSPQVGSDATSRNLPQTADVMAALGSAKADVLLSGDKRDVPKYSAALEKVKAEVYDYFKKGSENVYTDWLGMLALLFADKDSKQFFWNSPLWESKKLLTAAASWTELKHDTVLYSKQSYAEMGGGGEWTVEPFGNPIPRGYVEPAPQLFNAMFNALDRMREILAKYKLGDKDEESSWHGVRAKVEAFREHVMLFRDIAEKEVKDQPLSTDDYLAVAQVTSYLNSNLLLDSTTLSGEDGPADIERLKMALVSDVATDALGGRVLQVATGTPRRMYVFVDDKHSGPRVAVGYTYSFYEFERSLSDGRMTDEEWKKQVYDKTRQKDLEKSMPEWSKELFVE